MLIDLYMTYQFIKRLTTPFNKWNAYTTGVIDDKGTQLVKRNNMSLIQKSSFGIFDLMICKLKKLLGKLPGGTTRIASYAAALWLIKEWNCFTEETMLTEDISEKSIDISLENFMEYYFTETDANNAGDGQIAGLGPEGFKDKKQKYSSRIFSDPLIRRKTFKNFVGESSQEGTLGAFIAGEPGDSGMGRFKDKPLRKNKQHPLKPMETT